MRVLSWDVGIRNAAYCLMERYIDDKTGKVLYKTLSWGLIDLLERFERRCKCGRVAMWVTDTRQSNGEELAWCGQHVGAQGVIPCKEAGAKCINCGNKAYMIVKGRSKLKHCVKHTTLPKLRRYKKVSSKKFAVEKLKEVLISELELRPDFLFVQHVVIENQPSLTNPKMKAISETLFHWFMIRGKIDRQLYLESLEKEALLFNTNNYVSSLQYRYPSAVKSVEFISPSAKIPDRNITRELRKAKIMEICEQDIKDSEWELFYKKHPKRDDLADCHVQAKIIFRRLGDACEWRLGDSATKKWLNSKRS
jgi:hypothetical protein